MTRLTAEQAHWRLVTYETEVYIVAKRDIAHRKALRQLPADDYTLSDALDVVHEYLRQCASSEHAL